MYKKILVQSILLTIFIVISFVFFFKYIKTDNINKEEKKRVKISSINKNISSNYIDSINYMSSDAKGNRYQITAKNGEVDINNLDEMFLNDVVAYIHLYESDTIKITSNFGKYNSQNYDTIFSKNVIMIYTDHKITGEYLDFSLLKSLGTMSTNIIYSNSENELKADRVEIDITTKDSKIFMNDKIEKVKATIKE